VTSPEGVSVIIPGGLVSGRGLLSMECPQLFIALWNIRPNGVCTRRAGSCAAGPEEKRDFVDLIESNGFLMGELN